MKVTVIQQDIVWKTPVANRVKMEQLLRSAPQSDIYIFPEMCSTGFCMQPNGIAEESGGETLRMVTEWAKEFDAAIFVPILTAENGKFYNRMYFVAPDGVRGYYDKVHLFEYSGEDKVFEAGKHCVTWEWRGLRLRPAICYDLRFPITLHNYEGYDLLIIAANFPESRILAWDTLVRARAIENQCYVAAANRVGADEYGNYIGHSVIINAFGQTIAHCVDSAEGYATAEIDWEMIEKMRRAFPLMRDSIPVVE